MYVVCKYGSRVGGRNVSGFKVCEDFLWLPIVYSFSLCVDIRLWFNQKEEIFKVEYRKHYRVSRGTIPSCTTGVRSTAEKSAPRDVQHMGTWRECKLLVQLSVWGQLWPEVSLDSGKGARITREVSKALKHLWSVEMRLTWCFLKLEVGLILEGLFKVNYLLHDSLLTIFPVAVVVIHFFPPSFHLRFKI